MRTNFLFFEGTSIDVVAAELERAELKIEGIWKAVKIKYVTVNQGMQIIRKMVRVPCIATIVEFDSYAELLAKLWNISEFAKEVAVGGNNRFGYGLDSLYFNVCFANCSFDDAVWRCEGIVKAVADKLNLFVECYLIERDGETEGYGYYNPYKPNSIDFRVSYDRWGRAAREVLSRLGYKPSLGDAGVYLFRY